MIKDKILEILERICETDEVRLNPDVLLYETGILDSFATVSLLLALEEELGIIISISEVERDTWATPNMIIAMLEGK